jgi:peptide/nickel transport system permease protein
MFPLGAALRLPRFFAKGTTGRSMVIPVIAAFVLSVIILMAIFAPLLTAHDPLEMTPSARLQPANDLFLIGSDPYGRDLFSRVLYGARISLFIGVSVAIISIVIGLGIGLVSGFFRWVDAIIMRIMDALMAIPSLLLAIALVSLAGASIWTVMFAITVPEIPRVVRLVRSVILSAREEPYVEAAIVAGTSLPKVLWRHLMPNTIAPLIVQGTYICASAILTEAVLSFLGAGVSTDIPTWGNIMAEGRSYFQLRPQLVFWPGLALSLCILSINLLGDTARDLLDPRSKKREASK